MLTIILFSGLAGIIGTGLGGFIGIFLGGKTEKAVSMVLTFASGIMISIALFDLMPESYLISNAWITASGVLFGVVLIWAFNYFLDKKTNFTSKKPMAHSSLKELHHQENIINHSNESLLKVGVIMLIAIALHNVPEGMAIGTSGIINVNLSVTLAILLMLHNVPEGMAMAVPLVAGNVKRFKVLLLVIIAGSTTILGGVLGLIIGNINTTVLAISLAFAAGAMLYVTFGEILPQAILMRKNASPTIFTIFGIIMGFLVTTLF